MKNRLKITYNSPTILSFVLICLFVTILGVLTQNKSTELLFSVYKCSLKNPLAYIRVFTHIFGHSGFEHFFSNAMYLFLLGPMLEEKYGSITMIKVIVLTAFITGVIHFVFSGDTALCGASGVVFACIILSSFTGFKDGEIPLSFILVALLFIGQEVYKGITMHDNISYITHIIGGSVGGVFGYLLNKKR
ncbi:MAG: rhomboid family intramembrane serine protease [Eubacterium sp.]|nr:rhomboid family intramembrane serine protease [Eubacterium sp.]